MRFLSIIFCTLSQIALAELPSEGTEGSHGITLESVGGRGAVADSAPTSGAGGSGGGGGRGATTDGAKEAGDKSRQSIIKGVEESNKGIAESANNFYSGVLKGVPEQSIQADFAKSVSSIGQQSSSTVNDLTKGVILDIQNLNQIQINTLKEIAKQYAPAGSQSQSAPAPMGDAIQASPAARTSYNPGSPFATSFGSPLGPPQ